MAKDLDKVFNKFAADMKDDKFVRISKGVNFGLSGVVQFGVPTGLPQFDLHLERNGFPAGRMIEFYGFEHCGKTTLAMHAAAQYQRAGGQVLWVDTEKAWDSDRAIQLGCNVDDMWFADADSVEGIFRSIEHFLMTMEDANLNRPILAVVDSVAAVSNEWELGREFEGEARMGGDAKKIKGGVKRVGFKVAKTRANIIFINHAYESMTAFSSAKASGGRGVKFMSSLRVELSSKGELFKGAGTDKERFGQKIGVKLRKGRGSPLKHPNFDTELKADGFDQVGSLLLAAVDTGFIELESKQYKLAGETFVKEQWPGFLKSIGGFDKVYPLWMDHAIKAGFITKWGAHNDEID
jgi:recombination protein RecA